MESPSEDRLGSWKAIAAYVNRDVTTVQRWEKREGMPVHRHLHDKRGSVYAFPSELDAWMRDRRVPPKEEEVSPPPPRRPWWSIAAVMALVIAGLGWWLFMRSPAAAREPLAGARVTPLTDFDGRELAAAISRDGKFVAFLADRDGTMDAWVTQVGTGQFKNLTQAAAPQLLNPEVRNLMFTPDGSMVTFWTRSAGSEAINVAGVPTLGGALRNYRAGAVELDWSSDGSRMVFHTADPGDPTFVMDAAGGEPRQIHMASRGTHCHFQIWSPDDRHIYFVRGVPPDRMDLWRMKADGTDPEQLTRHDNWVGYPVFLDERTLLYLAASEDGSGPWLHSFDIGTRISRRIGFGVEQYTSLAASVDRRRLVATVEHARASLWRVPITGQSVDDGAATRITLPIVGGHAPRVGAGYLLFVAAKSDGHAVWALRDGEARELWSAPRARVIGGPAVAPDGERIAFSAESDQGTQLYVVGASDSGARAVASDLQIRGAPAWSPDGQYLTVSGTRAGGHPQIYKVSLEGAPPAVLHAGYALNPVWSGDGGMLVYADADVGPNFTLKAIKPDGSAHELREITLSRSARRVSFVPGQRALIVLAGDMRHANFWRIDLDTGERRQLTDFGREFYIRDFDVTPDGREIVFDRREDNSDVALIELP